MGEKLSNFRNIQTFYADAALPVVSNEAHFAIFSEGFTLSEERSR